MNIMFTNSISTDDYNYLRKSVGWNQISVKQAQTGINNSAYIVSALYESKTVGMARVVSDGGCIAIIVDVIVLPEFQSKGIGKTMMHMIMEFLKSSISNGEKILVNLMSAKGRESFYRQFGFIDRPDDKLGAGMTQWLAE